MKMVDSRYLLDTNTLSEFIRNPRGLVNKRLAVVGEARVCTSIVVACELRFRAKKKGSSRLEERVDEVLAGNGRKVSQGNSQKVSHPQRG